MNKISLAIVVISSALAGVMFGKFIYASESMSAFSWFALGINVVAVIISLSNIVNYGMDAVRK